MGRVLRYRVGPPVAPTRYPHHRAWRRLDPGWRGIDCAPSLRARIRAADRQGRDDECRSGGARNVDEAHPAPARPPGSKRRHHADSQRRITLTLRATPTVLKWVLLLTA